MLNIPEKELVVLRQLNKKEVRYVVFGGHAMQYHGCARETYDVDLLVRPDEENGLRLWAAISDVRGWYDPKLTPEQLSRPKVQLNLESNGYSVDILSSASKADFDTVFADAIRVNVGEVEQVSVISMAALFNVRKAAAAAAGDEKRRDKEMAAVAWLEARLRGDK